MTKRKKFLLILVCAVFLLGTMVGSASTYSKKITAWFYPIHLCRQRSDESFQSGIYLQQLYICTDPGCCKAFELQNPLE